MGCAYSVKKSVRDDIKEIEGNIDIKRVNNAIKNSNKKYHIIRNYIKYL